MINTALVETHGVRLSDSSMAALINICGYWFPMLQNLELASISKFSSPYPLVTYSNTSQKSFSFMGFGP